MNLKFIFKTYSNTVTLQLLYKLRNTEKTQVFVDNEQVKIVCLYSFEKRKHYL